MSTPVIGSWPLLLEELLDGVVVVLEDVDALVPELLELLELFELLPELFEFEDVVFASTVIVPCMNGWIAQM
jgi:hypothetical protein